MNHGEIHRYKLVPPDNKRPVLILTRDSVLEYLGEVTIAPITATVRNIPSEVLKTIIRHCRPTRYAHGCPAHYALDIH